MQSLTDIDSELDELISLEGGESLHDYIGDLSPSFGPPAWTRIVTDTYERARRKPVRICLSVPPRMGKTYTTLHGISKWIRDYPADTCVYSTYNARRAQSKSRIAREFAQRSGVEFSPVQNALGEWRTIWGGGLIAGGVASGVTGEGVQGVFVVDDPLKDRNEAESALRREVIWDWFNSAAFTRLEGASVVVIQTRWHADDLIGKLVKLGGWEQISLPAIAEKNDPLGRAVGESLDPIRFPVKMRKSSKALASLSDIERQIGPYDWASLYQQNPQSKGKKLFGPPTYYRPEEFSINGYRVVIGVDPAATEKASADHSVAVVLAIRGKGPDAEGYVLEVVRMQKEIPVLVEALAKLQKRYWGALLAVEAVGGFKAVPQMLRHLNPSLAVLEMPAHGDKFTRSQLVSAAWNDGRVRCPIVAPWMPAFVGELGSFTGVGDKHDDQVDALAHAWNSMAYAARMPRRGAYASP